MATLVFRVSAQYDEVIKLRNEISKLEAQLKKMDVNKAPAAARALETQLASTRQQMMGLVTEASKAGAVMERDFKNGIYNASQTVNNLSANITSQRGVIRKLQNELILLKEKYRETVKSSGDTTGMSEQIKAQTAKLREQKDILFSLTQQQAEARLSVKRLKDEYAAFKEEAGETVEANEKMSVSLTKVLGVIGGVTALKNFVTELVNVRGQFQQLEIAFTTMLKSKEKADKLMSELVDIAAKTPFDLQGVASSAKQMIAYGSSAENVGDELVMLGNVAAGVGSQLSEIAYLYGTLRTQGRAYAVDIRQFAGRGIPIYEELAKVLGVTKDEVSGLVTEGKVGFKEVEQAFKNMTGASGIYYNLMEEQSKSLTGQLSNLGDAWDTMLNEIGKDTQGIASAGISAVKGLIENYETVSKVLLGLIATYGTYKTATLALWVIEQARAKTLLTSIVSTKALTAAQTALNLVMKSNPYVFVATALVGVVSVMWAFHDSATESEKAQTRLNEAVSKVEDSVSKELSTLRSLDRQLAETKKGSDEWVKIKEQIIKNYSQYLPGLDDEIEKAGSLAAKYDELTESIRKAAAARSFNNVMSQEDDKYNELRNENLEKVYNSFIEKLGDEKGLKTYRKWLSYLDSGDEIPVKIQKQFAQISTGFSSNANSLLFDIRKQGEIRDEVLQKYKNIFNITDNDILAASFADNTNDKKIKEKLSTLSEITKGIQETEKSIISLRKQAASGKIRLSQEQKHKELPQSQTFPLKIRNS